MVECLIAFAVGVLSHCLYLRIRYGHENKG